MPDNKAEPSQLDKFRDLARELQADEDEARFEDTVRKIAPSPGKRSDVEDGHDKDANTDGGPLKRGRA